MSAKGSRAADRFPDVVEIVVEIPPLRDRLDDLPLLVNFLLEKYATKIGKKRHAFRRALIQPNNSC